MANPAISRITREIANAQKGTDLSIAVACRDSDVSQIRALIIGPPETPYQFGFFELDLTFPEDYPIKSPNVRFLTTNQGCCRFNPNIYAEGKVCLSILGTWRGRPGEEWSSAQGLESVLLSIQSLMSSNPYENEPGYESARKDDPKPKAYVAKIRHEALRISVIQRLEGLLQIQPETSIRESPSKKRKSSAVAHYSPDMQPLKTAWVGGSSASTPATEEDNATADSNSLDATVWDPFADLLKRRFLWYYDSYLRAIDTHATEQKDGEAFKRCDFEYTANNMEGVFVYKELRRRLEKIQIALTKETESWAGLGAAHAAKESQLATQLAFQFKQLQSKFRGALCDGMRIELSLDASNNPFVWLVTMFGEPMTNLDGGVFNITMHIPPDFPESQPRVIFSTPIFHHRVSSNGFLCYFPSKQDEISTHVDAIIAAIGDGNPTFDPRAMVNPETFDLFWGGDDKRRVYNRHLRRSARESCESL